MIGAGTLLRATTAMAREKALSKDYKTCFCRETERRNMNLVPAIKKMEEEINKMNFEHKKSIKELEDGLISLRKLNTVCEKCNGEGKYLRSRACAEDDRPNPNNPRDYIVCTDCSGSGLSKNKN